MRRRLPPLRALQAFEAGARHLSFSRAAEELSVTQTAISHQVRNLEQWFGVRLFVRKGREIALTDTGSRLEVEVALALDRIHEAAARVRASNERPALTVSVTRAFGAHWLAQRLGRFWRQYPGIDLRLHHSMYRADLNYGDVDLAVRWGPGVWEGTVSEYLVPARHTPVCSPILHIREVGDLAHQVLLHETDYQDWTEWLAVEGATEIDARRGPILDDVTAIVEAAVQGGGVTLSLPSLLEHEFKTGKLVAPFERKTGPANAYYVLYLPGALEQPEIRAFRDFLFDELERSSDTGWPRLSTAPG